MSHSAGSKKNGVSENIMLQLPLLLPDDLIW